MNISTNFSPVGMSVWRSGHEASLLTTKRAGASRGEFPIAYPSAFPRDNFSKMAENDRNLSCVWGSSGRRALI